VYRDSSTTVHTVQTYKKIKGLLHPELLSGNADEQIGWSAVAALAASPATETATSATKRKLLQPRQFKSEETLKQSDTTQSKV
jgi:hypothetical protein